MIKKKIENGVLEFPYHNNISSKIEQWIRIVKGDSMMSHWCLICCFWLQYYLYYNFKTNMCACTLIGFLKKTINKVMPSISGNIERVILFLILCYLIMLLSICNML